MRFSNTRFRVFVITVVCVICRVSAADEPPDPVAQSLGLTPANRALPLWQKPTPSAVKDLSGVVRRLQQGVFLVGHPKHGYGTAFVISKKHRLLITNAHVADIKHQAGSMLAIRNGSSDVYRVAKVWYHPGVLRKTASSLTIRSQNPVEGTVQSNCPDIAVISLAPGLDLPVEFALATKSELDDAFARPVAMLGFPGHDTMSWPVIGEKAGATFRQGVVSRLTDFFSNVNAPKSRLQFVQHSMATWFGFSGSPIFLPNGHVVSINNSRREVSLGSSRTSLAYGIRADCVWELLAHHGLDAKVPIGVKKSALDLARFKKPDPRLKLLSRAKNICWDATVLLTNDKHTKAGNKLDEIASFLPDFPEAHLLRGLVHRNYVATYGARISRETEFKQIRLAQKSNKKYMQLAPSDPWGMIRYCDLMCLAALATADHRKQTAVPKAVIILTKLIDNVQLNYWTRADAHRVRAIARGFDSEESLTDLNESIRLAPFLGVSFETRSSYWSVHDNLGRAEKDQRRAEELYAAQRTAYKALDIVDSPEHLDEAIALATRACKTTDHKYWAYLFILAEACYAKRDFSAAARWATRAIQLAPPEKKGQLQRLVRDTMPRLSAPGSRPAPPDARPRAPVARPAPPAARPPAPRR